MAARRTTIGDVAAAAGVSVATVSKVINNRYGVSATTLQHVRAVIKELGYESSLVARSLRSHRTGVIGVVVSDIEPFSAELLKGAADELRATDYELIVYSGSGHGPERQGWERRSISRLSGTLTDGIILVTPTVVDVGDASPVVAVDPHTGTSDLPSVHADNFAGAVLATAHLLELGHRRIGLLAGRPDLASAREREAGFRHALQAAGIELDPELVVVGSYEAELAEQPAHELLQHRSRPTAIFAANDRSAIETMHVARTLGLDVPGDLSVIGFDNIPESALCSPPLTTIDQSIQRMGAEAVRLLLGLIARPDANGDPDATTATAGTTAEEAAGGTPADGSAARTAARQITIPTELVVRQSCGGPVRQL